MKKWMICAVVCLAGACAKQAEPGAPLQFAPAPPPGVQEEAPATPTPESAEQEDEAAAEEPRPSEIRPDQEVDSRGGNAAQPSDGAKAEERAEPAKRAPSKPNAKPSAAACDATCTKLCASAKDKTKCAEAYGKGCFDGSAPAAFDCEGFGKKPAEGGDGVEAQDTPTVGF
ncbi:MAG: hypothetical protein R3E66_11200 [bacterium]